MNTIVQHKQWTIKVMTDLSFNMNPIKVDPWFLNIFFGLITSLQEDLKLHWF